ncbi:hypothetical protein D3875_15845 [Deinococcus cavernae]|uniref:Uncharacterized protein n=1 Tax=Deinococcus cavernae TaxID=2320857 RepID=A0A418V9K1_9DEIO|nr:hypothetical protein [Deinococcus cavernae]RJF72795.1 hypothetical protein D3875_15845 [Deinococcus cavernae]
MTKNDDYRDRNGTDKQENAGQGEGHRQIGNQVQPQGGDRYRDDADMPHEEGSPGNEKNQGQDNPEGGQGSGTDKTSNDS